MKLAHWQTFDYCYYTDLTDHHLTIYNSIEHNLTAMGTTLRTIWQPDQAIILENNRTWAAAVFFNTREYANSILIINLYVQPEYRQQGIYTRLHELIDMIAVPLNKQSVYSFIDQNNDLMQTTVKDRIGYRTVMHLVKRDIL